MERCRRCNGELRSFVGLCEDCWAAGLAPTQSTARARPCAVCGRLFCTDDGRRRCCSRECTRAHGRALRQRWEKRRQRQRRRGLPEFSRPCVVCGLPFVGRTAAQRTCGPVCSREHKRRLVRAWKAGSNL